MIDLRHLEQGVRDRARFFSDILRQLRNRRFEFTDDGRVFLSDMNAFSGGWFKTRVVRPNGEVVPRTDFSVFRPIFDDQGGLLLPEQDEHGFAAIHNLLTTEGRTHVWSAVVAGGTQITTWYLAPFTGNVTPAAGWTAANFTSTATEATAYDESTRVAYVEGTPASGNVDNSASLARFTANAAIEVYGFGMLSASAKSATTGVLLAAARDANAPISLAAGYKVDVEYALALTSS